VRFIPGHYYKFNGLSYENLKVLHCSPENNTISVLWLDTDMEVTYEYNYFMGIVGTTLIYDYQRNLKREMEDL
jgi:hypothetical protein